MSQPSDRPSTAGVTLTRGLETADDYAKAFADALAEGIERDLEAAYRKGFADGDNAAASALEAAQHLIAGQAETLGEWLKANAPGGWIDDIRLERNAAESKLSAAARLIAQWREKADQANSAGACAEAWGYEECAASLARVLVEQPKDQP